MITHLLVLLFIVFLATVSYYYNISAYPNTIISEFEAFRENFNSCSRNQQIKETTALVEKRVIHASNTASEEAAASEGEKQEAALEAKQNEFAEEAQRRRDESSNQRAEVARHKEEVEKNRRAAEKEEADRVIRAARVAAAQAESAALVAEAKKRMAEAEREESQIKAETEQAKAVIAEAKRKKKVWENRDLKLSDGTIIVADTRERFQQFTKQIGQSEYGAILEAFNEFKI